MAATLATALGELTSTHHPHELPPQAAVVTEALPELEYKVTIRAFAGGAET